MYTHNLHIFYIIIQQWVTFPSLPDGPKGDLVGGPIILPPLLNSVLWMLLCIDQNISEPFLTHLHLSHDPLVGCWLSTAQLLFSHPWWHACLRLTGIGAIETHSFIWKPNKKFLSQDNEILFPASRITPLSNATIPRGLASSKLKICTSIRRHRIVSATV